MQAKILAILAMMFLSSSSWAFCPQQETTVVFMNGVWITKKDASDHKEALAKEVYATGISPDCVHFEYSHTQDDGKTADIVEAMVQKSQEFGVSIPSLVRMLLRLIPITSLFGDAVTSVYNQVDEVIEAQLDRHEQKVRELAFDKGHRAVIVTHSQGGLYGNALWNRFSSADQADTRLVAVTSPAGSVADGGPHTRLLRDGVANLFFAFATNEGLIDNTERLCDTEAALLPYNPNFVGPIFAIGHFSFACHGFETGYLHDSEARKQIINDIIAALPASPPESQIFAYITNFGSNTVSVIDTVTNTVVATVPVGTQAVGVTVNPSGTRVYVTNGAPDNVVTVIDATQLPANPNAAVLGVIPVGIDPEGIDITPNGNTLYVANSDSGTVSVINVANDSNMVITTIVTGGDLVGVVTHPDSTRAYVADGSGRRVRVINTATNTVSATIAVGNANNGPNGIATNPAGTRVYVTANNFGLQVIDADLNSPTFHTVIATIPVGSAPSSVAVNPSGTRAYVTNNGSNNVSVIDITSDVNTVIATVTVGSGPRGVGIHPDGTVVYVAQEGNNTVTVIDAVNNVTVPPPIPVGSGPIAFGKFIGLVGQ